MFKDDRNSYQKAMDLLGATEQEKQHESELKYLLEQYWFTKVTINAVSPFLTHISVTDAAPNQSIKNYLNFLQMNGVLHIDPSSQLVNSSIIAVNDSVLNIINQLREKELKQDGQLFMARNEDEESSDDTQSHNELYDLDDSEEFLVFGKIDELSEYHPVGSPQHMYFN